MKKLQTWQLVLLIVFYPIGIIYFIVWLCKRNKQPAGAVRVDSSKLTILTEFHTKVVGVSFNNNDGTSRQDIIKSCKVGDDIIFKPVPTKEYPDAIGVFNAHGKQLGHLTAELASELKNKYPTNPMKAVVAGITGGENGKNYGCNLKLTIYNK